MDPLGSRPAPHVRGESAPTTDAGAVASEPWEWSGSCAHTWTSSWRSCSRLPFSSSSISRSIASSASRSSPRSNSTKPWPSAWRSPSCCRWRCGRRSRCCLWRSPSALHAARPWCLRRVHQPHARGGADGLLGRRLGRRRVRPGRCARCRRIGRPGGDACLGRHAEPRDLAAPVFLLVGAWLLGLAVRSFRAARGDERSSARLDWESEVAAPDSAGRDEPVRELRDVIERAMSAVILQARNARRSLADDPASAQRALARGRDRRYRGARGDAAAYGTAAFARRHAAAGAAAGPGRPGLPRRAGHGGRAARSHAGRGTAAAADTGPRRGRLSGRPRSADGDARASHLGAARAWSCATSPTSCRSRSSTTASAAGDDAEKETAGLMAVRKEVAALGGTLDAGPGTSAATGCWRGCPTSPTGAEPLLSGMDG